MKLKLLNNRLLLVLGIIVAINISCDKNDPTGPENVIPYADFTISETYINIGDEIDFKSISSDLDGEIVKWFWNFGDNNTSTDENPTHKYESEGDFTVTLEVTDDKGGSNKKDRNINVIPKPEFEKLRMKVMTFNIHAGVSITGVYDLDAIAAVINKYDPDYVALQEVDYNTERNGRDDIAKILAEKTNMNYVFGKAIPYQDGEFGNAMLSKKAIESSKNYEMPYENEERAAIKISSKVDDYREIELISTHLDYGEDSDSEMARVESANRINDLFASNEEMPAIVSGDFNDLPSSEMIRVFKEKWTFTDPSNTPTFPSDGPNKKIDYIAFYPNNRWEVIDVLVIENTLESDHNPMLVTIDLIMK
jgi:endonuclease/exonuclease/phosphatase family metal-dependent hydrolase